MMRDLKYSPAPDERQTMLAMQAAFTRGAIWPLHAGLHLVAGGLRAIVVRAQRSP